MSSKYESAGSPIFPAKIAFNPDCFKTWKIRDAVVLFPLVPVTPIIFPLNNSKKSSKLVEIIVWVSLTFSKIVSLIPGVTKESLIREQMKMSHLEAAMQLQRQKSILFSRLWYIDFSVLYGLENTIFQGRLGRGLPSC